MRSDVELLDAWRGGDNEAGDVLVQRHFEAVCRFFRTKVDDEVEDLLQRTFLRCVRARERLREGSSFRAFLFTAARSELFDHYRRRRAAGRVFADGQASSVHDLGASPSALLVRDEERRLLVHALQRIPLDLQIALELFYWEELSGPELAEVLEIPQGTVRSRLRRGITLVREQMESLARSPELLRVTLRGLDEWAAAVRDEASDEPG